MRLAADVRPVGQVVSICRGDRFVKDVISFSLYGGDSKYCVGALLNVELAHVIYPGWTCRFYVDDTVPDTFVAGLLSLGAEVITMARAPWPMYGRYWRLYVAADDTVARYIIRDADSRLNLREKAAVDAWVGSGKTFHLMRDSKHHKTRALAGMWGGMGGSIKNIRELVERWGQYDAKGQCDRFVSEVIFPLMGDDYICHDSAGYYSDGVPFPTHPPLTQTSYVGQIIDVESPITDIWRHAGELEDANVVLQGQIVELTRALHEMHASLSWRVTAPARAVLASLARLIP
jgi:hypothetical protein